jgi:hypothetical protein
MRSNTNRRLRVAFPAVILLLVAVLLSGCVTPIPLEKEAPDLSYKAATAVVVSVVDERDVLAQGKPPTFIGRAHSLFGIPADMQVYPWFVSDKTRKDQTLAQALEERIVVGLSDEGWQVTGAGSTARLAPDAVVAMLASRGAPRMVILSITQWFASINLNWVTAFNFDWGYRLEVLDAQGHVVASVVDSGRDVVDEKADESPQNMMKLAFRDRLIKILERPELQAALQP